jgi:N-acetyl-anhydromuramyl-L-alanine amidase AmpD
LLPAHPRGLVIHHSATPGRREGKLVTLDELAAYHEKRGWGLRYQEHVYHIGYHFVILADGTVQEGRPPWMPGAHAQGHNDMLGVCLVGDFSKGRQPTTAQLDAAVALVRKLCRRYHLSPEQIHRHGDLNSTLCPGESFPWEDFLDRVAAED